ncbi:MAG: hypothetical protein PHR56_05460 [Dehalococcoidales bacterium]|nr:hypothetical protein [Dehalococcoidales bacterium]
MGKRRLFRALVALVLSVVLLFMIFPAFSQVVFADLPEPSASYDCDDATLSMYQRLARLGIKATPILGDLKATGETYGQTTHVWLLVKLGSVSVAFDWGTPWLDRQHYEGYQITLDQLVEFVHQDTVIAASKPGK